MKFPQKSTFGTGFLLGAIVGMSFALFLLINHKGPVNSELPNVAACKAAGGFMIRRGQYHSMCVKEIRKR